jgi:hypothetical protein
MNEAEWQGGSELLAMLAYLHGRSSARKWRLFSCACVREVGHLLPDRRSRQVFFVAERFADGLATAEELAGAHREARAIFRQLFSERGSLVEEYDRKVYPKLVTVHDALVQATTPALDPEILAHSTSRAVLNYYHDRHWVERVQKAQCNLLRDIFGNPFRPLNLNPRWLSTHASTAIEIARAIYLDRTFDELPILADALIDADCDSEELIRHCREAQDHGRGCWAIDALLGRE